MPEPTVSLSLRVTPEQFKAIEERARVTGVSRSVLVREMIGQLVGDAPSERAATHDRAA